MSNWHQIKEQRAGKYRLTFLWFVYRLFRLTGLKIILYPVVALLFPGLSTPREHSQKYRQILYTYEQNHHLSVTRFSSYSHILSYATAMAEKMDALCNDGKALHFTIHQNTDAKTFLNNLKSQKGMFLISSHLGNIEILSALAQILPHKNQKLFALMQTNQNSIFFQFIQQHIKNKNFELIPAQNLDFQQIMNCYEDVQSGALWLMAGDRTSQQNTNTLLANCLDKQCLLPQGVFKFAKALKHPVFVITCLRTKDNTYTLYVKQLKTDQTLTRMAQDYMDFIQKLLLIYPDQWYNFFDFFNDKEKI